MEKDIETKWISSFKYLTLQETGDPLIAIARFFDNDWLPEQLARLEAWRNFVLQDAYFVDRTGNPASLLAFYEMNVRLIEAVWVLFQRGVAIGSASINDLSDERDTWRDFPSNLGNDELCNPYAVLVAFFAVSGLDEYSRQLREWLHFGLLKMSANGWIDTSDLVMVYEQLQKLYSAVWMIHQRSCQQPYLKIDRTDEQAINISTEQASGVNLYRLNSVITYQCNQLLSDVVKIIVSKIATVQAVIHLGVSPDQPEKLFLLVLTGNEEHRQAQHLNSIIEQSCEAVAKVTALVHYSGSFKTAVSKGNLFFCRALACPVVYLSGGLLLPSMTPATDSPQDLADVPAYWERWYKQGSDFLQISEYSIEQHSPNTALFLLHQATECLLIAIIRVVLGYDVNNHNLSRLFAITEMFTSDHNSVFDLRDEKDKQLFDTLKQAYIAVRYRDDYAADLNAVKTLQGKVKHLYALINALYKRHMLVNNL